MGRLIKTALDARGAIFATGCALVIGGCSLTLPVRGVLDASDEVITGSATGYANGSGNLEITTSKGVKCSGSFVYVTARQGEGVFQCTDGRSGPFSFVSTGTNGTGHGELSGKRFTFTFG